MDIENLEFFEINTTRFVLRKGKNMIELNDEEIEALRGYLEYMNEHV
jgi:hypothetical protein